jgi:uncharacterized protein
LVCVTSAAQVARGGCNLIPAGDWLVLLPASGVARSLQAAAGMLLTRAWRDGKIPALFPDTFRPQPPEAGNSPQMVFRHYRKLVKEKEADAWFAITPKAVEEASGCAEEIRESILAILCTRKGERVLGPDFGSENHKFVFEPIVARTLALIKTAVREALVCWEPRIELNDVDARPDDYRESAVLIGATYTLRFRKSVENLVYRLVCRKEANETRPPGDPLSTS